MKSKEKHFDKRCARQVSEPGAGKQGEALRETVCKGIVIITTRLDGGDVGLKSANEQTIRVFSEPLLKSLSDKLFARGVGL